MGQDGGVSAEEIPLRAVADPNAPLARRPIGSGDGWVQGPEGQRYWGTFGAAGLLVVHPGTGVLLQHRADYSHFGGTWGLPGGARHEGETAAEGAVREAAEEAGVPADALSLSFQSVWDLGWWSYTTVVAHVDAPFTPVIGDAESLEVAWVPIERVGELPLHPGFAASWPELRTRLTTVPVLLVDGAGEIGQRVDDLAGQFEIGFPGELIGLPFRSWWTDLRFVEASDDTAADLEHALEHALEEDAEGGLAPYAVVFTESPAVAARAEAAGARVVRTGKLLDLLDRLDLD